jgi:hypothetical protein
LSQHGLEGANVIVVAIPLLIDIDILEWFDHDVWERTVAEQSWIFGNHLSPAELKTGAEILFRSLEETNAGKLLNLTLGGVFVDQISHSRRIQPAVAAGVP